MSLSAFSRLFRSFGRAFSPVLRTAKSTVSSSLGSFLSERDAGVAAAADEDGLAARHVRGWRRDFLTGRRQDKPSFVGTVTVKNVCAAHTRAVVWRG